MSGFRWVRMADEELDEFLGTGGTGILSFSTSSAEPPFSRPVSYGYYQDSAHFHYRLAVSPNNTKKEYLDRPVSFVVHERAEGRWQSVIAIGELEALDDLPYEATARQERWGVDIPWVDIFEDPPEDITFEQFRLVPDELTGRTEITADD